MKSQTPLKTEMLRDAAVDLDLKPNPEILSCLLQGQQDALASVAGSLNEIAAGAEILTETIRQGGRIFYAAAGSSGLMCLADAAELSGTFGLPPERIRICMAGGVPTDAAMPGHTEDDEAEAQTAAKDVTAQDAVIAISASGSTPFAVAFAKLARNSGAQTICIANNPDAKLFTHSTCAIHLQTPPEIIAGSTRMGAATAQKAALNLMSTLMGIRLGHVLDGLMVNVIADNKKLKARALGIVKKITGSSDTLARDALTRSEGHVKTAILLAAGVSARDRAEQILQETGGQVRPALERLKVNLHQQGEET